MLYNVEGSTVLIAGSVVQCLKHINKINMKVLSLLIYKLFPVTKVLTIMVKK